MFAFLDDGILLEHFRIASRIRAPGTLFFILQTRKPRDSQERPIGLKPRLSHPVAAAGSVGAADARSRREPLLLGRFSRLKAHLRAWAQVRLSPPTPRKFQPAGSAADLMYDSQAIHAPAINDPRFAGGNPNGIFALEGTWEWVSPVISSNEP